MKNIFVGLIFLVGGTAFANNYVLRCKDSNFQNSVFNVTFFNHDKNNPDMTMFRRTSFTSPGGAVTSGKCHKDKPNSNSLVTCTAWSQVNFGATEEYEVKLFSNGNSLYAMIKQQLVYGEGGSVILSCQKEML